MSDTGTDASDQVQAFDVGQARGNDMAGLPTSAVAEPPPMGPCLLCFKRGRWPGFYCSPEHEELSKKPAGLSLYDKPHPNHRLGATRPPGRKRR